MNDAELIQAFVNERAETAFRSLVERHLPLVIGTARRITGDHALAEEVAQTVFILLARKAASLRQGTIVSGWLYRTTCFVAARALRGERRRQRREQEAVAMQTQIESEPPSAELAAHLDHALRRLSQRERDAVLLRFYEKRPLPEVSSTLGISEDAAKKRVTRALEKLRHFFRGRGSQITSAAIIAGLAHESAKASVNAAIISEVTTTALAPCASSALVSEILAAWRWTKIKLALGVGSGVVATALIVSHTIPTSNAGHNRAAQQPSQSLAAGGSNASISPAPSSDTSASSLETMDVGGTTLPAHALKITVLDGVTGDPIAGAEVWSSLSWSGYSDDEPVPLRTSAKGTVTFAVPNHIPGDERINQFDVAIHAKEYAPREIMWLSSTGSVFGLVSNGYTVRLEAGLPISGTVVDEHGQPLEGVRVGVLGNNYKGYSWSSDENGKVTSPPVLRVEDFSSFQKSSEKADAAVSDRFGRFHFAHFPSDLKAVIVDVIGQDGARRKFKTSQGKQLSSEDMPEVSFDELAKGTARLVLPAGTTVEGVVVDATGEPVIGATVSEGSQWGNLRILSSCLTDYEGRFWLSNRPPHEIILAASADGHASASVIASIKKGMKPVRIELPPEQPLRGRVVNESGAPISGAGVLLYDIYNEGLGMKWEDKTDSEGRFQWRGAPTNEVALTISAPDTFKLVRLRASTNEQLITLAAHNNNSAYVTGTVADATSGKPIDQFTVKVCHFRGVSHEVGQRTDGQNGAFSVNTSQSEVAVGDYPHWSLLVEADGYEPLMTRQYDYAEGNQKLDLKLQPGWIEGHVRSPEGQPVSECEVAVACVDQEINSYQSGQLSPSASQRRLATTDSDGHFKLTKLLEATSLVVFDDSGWAIAPLPTDSRNLDIQLRPWGRIEGELLNGNVPVAGETVGIDNLIQAPQTGLLLLQSVQTDERGHFAFEKVPAGNYNIFEEAGSWQRMGQEGVEALQKAVSLAVGETNHVVLSDTGGTLTAKLLLPPSIRQTSWTNCLAVLKRDVSVPARPNRADFVTDTSFTAALTAYTENPDVFTATRQVRQYVGVIAADGSVTFENIPPGEYVLEVKLFSNDDQNRYNPFKIVAQTSAPVTLPTTANDTGAPVALGSFTLDAL